MFSTKPTALSTKKNSGSCVRLSAYCLVLCCITGCVTRRLTIKTNPPGALVYVDDEFKGKTPVTYDFLWYGPHRVLVRKDGYARVDDRPVLNTPIYFWIPFDLITELLPIPIKDQRVWSYELSPAASSPAPEPPELSTSAQTPAVLVPTSHESAVAGPAAALPAWAPPPGVDPPITGSSASPATGGQGSHQSIGDSDAAR